MYRFIKKFFRKKLISSIPAPTVKEDKPGWHFPQTADQLLNTPHRQKQLNTIWQNVSMTPDNFQQLYGEPIRRYAELVQLLPASETHHHAYLGGMLDHGLEVIALAAKLRQNYVLPQNAPPEEQAKQRDVWSALIIYAALLHDIGKIAVDIKVVLENEKQWFPWQGRPTLPYRFCYHPDRDYELHPTLGTFLLHYLVPPIALDWLATFPGPFATLMYYASGHSDKAGILAEIVQKADQLSVTMALGGDINKLDESPKVSFAKQLQLALRHVVKGFNINNPKGGSQAYVNEQGVWVMSKTTTDAVRAYLVSQGISVPVQNAKLFDEMQTYKLIEPASDNMAVWTCKIATESWQPQNNFTFLRLSPQLIWPNVTDRPENFKGTITPVDSEGNILNLDTVNESPKPVIDTEPVLDVPTADTVIDQTKNLDDTLMDAVLDMFGSTETSEPAEISTIDEVPAAVELSQVTESEVSPIEAEAIQNTDPVIESISIETVAIEKQEKQESRQPRTPAVMVDANMPKIRERESTLPPTDLTTFPRVSNTPKNFVKPRQPQPVQPTKTSLDPSNKIQIDDFIQWVKVGFQTNKIKLNQSDALLHIVENHLFMVTPQIFRLYVIEQTGRSDQVLWESLQKDFQKLNLHTVRYDSESKDYYNFWTVKIQGSLRETELTGYLVKNFAYFIGSRTVLNNHHLKLQGNLTNESNH
ncbi:hypothetical protein A6A19_07905 [Actinobacillus delphinicola]|uniref:MobH family relaxase n=1 Tax=Actinobacillus delphinicola TaxID=51161 RepID=UPI00244143B6|nr:MobH family relaxase [Actinobacillus delphinicola]MDG6897897.1 hypothetical protein [Actinobacillus delphinicola]